ncbi:ribonuclease P protein subunit p14-like [Ornithodoros turicata]|uniref:ribonuclease P protein subunit p14-like n=1 Tax=Ornithodoros turicata TaxID=34597 RepID=UPI00313A3868
MEGKGVLHVVVPAEHVYLDVALNFVDSDHPEMSAKLFKYAIMLALKQLHGEVGAGIPIDVLRYDKECMRAYLRTSVDQLVKVWSSLTLFSSYNNSQCSFRVYKVSHNLAALSVSSNAFQHVIVAPDGK